MLDRNQPEKIRQQAIDPDDAVRCKDVSVIDQSGTLYVAVAEPAPDFLDLTKGDKVTCYLDPDTDSVFFTMDS